MGMGHAALPHRGDQHPFTNQQTWLEQTIALEALPSSIDALHFGNHSFPSTSSCRLKLCHCAIQVRNQFRKVKCNSKVKTVLSAGNVLTTPRWHPVISTS